MGREIRRVPLNWKHPTNMGGYKPLYEKSAAKKYKGEPVGYQLYENVTEGTPLSPVFEKSEDLVVFLISKQDFWGRTWEREAIEGLLEHGHAPSLILAGDADQALMPHEKNFWKKVT